MEAEAEALPKSTTSKTLSGYQEKCVSNIVFTHCQGTEQRLNSRTLEQQIRYSIAQSGKAIHSSALRLQYFSHLWFVKLLSLITVDSAFNELGYGEIFEFLNIHFFKTDFFHKDITAKGDKILFFLGSLN